MKPQAPDSATGQQAALPFGPAEPSAQGPASTPPDPRAGSPSAHAQVADPFVAQLAELCREHPTRSKWVFVPTYAVGHTLADRIAREGTSWANLRVTTPLDLAIRMAGPFLVERQVNPSEEPLGPALVMRLLLGLDRAPGTGYFRPMAQHTTLAVALWSTLRELRFAGLRADDLVRDAFESAEKHAELVALFEAYEAYLGSNQVADMALVFEEALRQIPILGPRSPMSRADPAAPRATYCPIRADDLWTELPDTPWPPIVRRFLDGLPGERVVPRALLVPGLAPTPRLARVAAPCERVSPEATGNVNGAARLRFLRAPADAGPVRNDGTLDLFHAGGRDAEVEEVFRRLVSLERPLDQVEIVCASPAHVLLAWEKARRLDWPVTVSSGLPAAATRPGRAVLAWCEWVEGGFAASDLRRLLQSGDLRPSEFAGDDETRLSTSQAARLLLRAEASWGRATYAIALDAYAVREESRARHEEGADAARRRQRARQARRLLAWVEGLLGQVPEPDAREGPQVTAEIEVTAVLDAVSTFVRANASRGSDLDAGAHVAVGDALEGLRSLGPMRGSLTLALRFVREAVERVAVGASRPRPGHLHVSSLHDGGFDGRPVVFVVGLEEARVFPVAVEDPVLLDAERRRISAASGLDAPLRTANDRLDESVFSIVSNLARIGCSCEQVTLSFSSFDTRDFRDTFPSWLLLQAFRLKEGRADLSYEDLRKWLGEPASAVPSTPGSALTEASWCLLAGRAGEPTAGAVVERYPSIGRGLAASAQRAADEHTSYDGRVEAAGRALDPTRRGAISSPTTLEDIAKCPFRFFLKAGLGVEPIEDAERDADVWLDPLTRGNELHALYAELTRRARDAKRRVSRRADLEWFLALARARLDELRVEMPPPSDEVFTTEREEVLLDLEAFVEAEERLTGIEPVAFEVSFGRPLDEGADELAQSDPVVIPLGGKRGLVLAGRVDRIDRAKPHQYFVTDYKTGKFWRDDYEGTFVKGTLLQHALYGRAVEALLRERDPKARVTHGVYWFPTGRGWGRRVSIGAPADKDLAGTLSDLVGVISGGTFTHAPLEKTCDWCNFRSACGNAPWENAKRKIEANVDGRLDAWVRLKERP